MRPFRGTYDKLPPVFKSHHMIESTAMAVSHTYGYDPIQTPIFEYAEVFSRTLGESSDVVTKEMFAFEDRHGDAIVLRPEGTAGIMRAILSNKLLHELPLKYCYAGPMFRYERPQKGRYRQFHQIGVELLGEEAPGGDVEVIAMGATLLERLGLQDKVTLHINTLGDEESRAAYRTQLVSYFSDHQRDLSEESQKRLETNPLRILDSKNEGDRRLIEEAPRLAAHLNGASQDFFGKVLEGLDVLKIPYLHDHTLVRGLDYYCHTAFEFVTESLGAQGAVLAGGRYDKLAQLMGHKDPIPSVGWAAGVERLALMSDSLDLNQFAIAVVPIGAEAETHALTLADGLRRETSLRVSLSHKGSLKSRMKYANKIKARYAVLIGETELEKKEAVVKDLDEGTQDTVAIVGLRDYFLNRVKELYGLNAP